MTPSKDNMTETADTTTGWFNSTMPQSTATTPRNASLEGVPAELKKLILHSAPNILALQTLVRSSPLYHKVYLDDRKAILSAVLLRDIGTDVLPDALAVHKAFKIGYDQPGGRRKDAVKSFILQYNAERGSSSSAICDSLDIQTLESLSRLQAVVAKIAFDFCETTLSIHPVTAERIQSHGELSPNEKRRIYRALYRFELYRALFDRPRGTCVPSGSDYHFDPMDKSFEFLHIFKVWEVEELACVRDYIIRCYTEILRESSSELSKLRSRRKSNDGFRQRHNIGYFMSCGLLFLCRCLNASSAAQKALILAEIGNTYSGSDFLTEALEEPPYDWVYQTDMYYDAEVDGRELLSEDDSLVDGPNAAWPWSTNHKVCIMFFEGHKQPLREWAYVMWDLGRLEDWRILEVDPKQLFGP